MKKLETKKVVLAGLLAAVAVVGSLFSFPILGSRAAPVQHMVNIIAAVLIGPHYSIAVAFSASLLRNLLGLGTIMAFPGSMIGAYMSGLFFLKTGNLIWTALGEIIGTGILGGLLAWPLAILFLGESIGTIAFYAYLLPFLLSTLVGAVIAVIIIQTMVKNRLIELGEGDKKNEK